MEAKLSELTNLAACQLWEFPEPWGVGGVCALALGELEKGKESVQIKSFQFTIRNKIDKRGRKSCSIVWLSKGKGGY